MRTLRPLLLLLLVAGALAPAAAHAAPRTVWLCRPGLAQNPCAQSQRTTDFAPGGRKLRVHGVTPGKRRIDCFYVYPTVSDQKSDLATLRIDPEERSIALYQASRYSRECRVFAPIYRQHTIAWLLKREQGKVSGPLIAPESLADVRRAFSSYLKHDNHGRGFVLIGHSQGSYLLRQFIAKEIDPKPALRRRLVSAILLGGNVLVRKGSDVGGDFRHIRACHTRFELGCVIAFSTYNAPPPPDSLFGRPASPTLGGAAPKGVRVLCTSPAALGGGAGLTTTQYPTAPFAPGTVIGGAVVILGNQLPKAMTPWVSVTGSYSARCVTQNGASVLRVTERKGTPKLKPSPDPRWGLHLVDANVALGQLVDIVRSEAAAYARARG